MAHSHGRAKSPIYIPPQLGLVWHHSPICPTGPASAGSFFYVTQARQVVWCRSTCQRCSVDKWRTPEADEYRRLYGTKQWKILRAKALLRDGFKCSRCKCFLKQGRTLPQSAVVHHIKAHKGDLELFFDLDNLQAVCWSCHSGAIQSEEARGYSTEIGPDGWPTDPNHPIGRCWRPSPDTGGGSDL